MKIEQFVRIGIDYFRETEIPMMNDTLTTLQRWNKQTIIDDFGKDAVADLKKYNGFCVIPSHENYQREINGFYNRYEPLSYKPQLNGEWKSIEMLLRHIFQEQYKLGIDYLTLLWRKPTQILPILCFVSDERNTGKTTILNLLKLIFEGNMTLNTNEDFRSRFNSDWSGKLIVAIDEVLLDKKEDSERIKNLSTARLYKKEAKGKDKEEVEFFGKFILCSNNEENFIKIDANEIRYWVRKIPTLGKNVNPNLLDELKKEIPSFVHFLSKRTILTKQETRMWFTKEQIYTNALKVLIEGNKTNIEKELEEILIDEFSYFDIKELCYTAKNIVEMLRTRNINVPTNYVATVLKAKYNLKEPKNSSYKYYRSSICNAESPISTGFTLEKGRFFVFKREQFIKSS